MCVWRYRPRRVAKTVFELPMLHGNRCSVLPMQRGDAKTRVNNTSAARMRLPQLVAHVSSGKTGNHEIRFFKKHEIQECAFGGRGEQHSVETPTPASQPTQPSEANNNTTTTINKFRLRTRKGSTSTSGKRFWSPRLSLVDVACCICKCFHRRPLAV